MRKPHLDLLALIVLDDFGERLGRAYCETGEADADEKTIIENIISGEYSHPVRVVAFKPPRGGHAILPKTLRGPW